MTVVPGLIVDEIVNAEAVPEFKTGIKRPAIWAAAVFTAGVIVLGLAVNAIILQRQRNIHRYDAGFAESARVINEARAALVQHQASYDRMIEEMGNTERRSAYSENPTYSSELDPRVEALKRIFQEMDESEKVDVGMRIYNNASESEKREIMDVLKRRAAGER